MTVQANESQEILANLIQALTSLVENKEEQVPNKADALSQNLFIPPPAAPKNLQRTERADIATTCAYCTSFRCRTQAIPKNKGACPVPVPRPSPFLALPGWHFREPQHRRQPSPRAFSTALTLVV